MVWTEPLSASANRTTRPPEQDKNSSKPMGNKTCMCRTVGSWVPAMPNRIVRSQILPRRSLSISSPSVPSLSVEGIRLTAPAPLNTWVALWVSLHQIPFFWAYYPAEPLPHNLSPVPAWEPLQGDDPPEASFTASLPHWFLDTNKREMSYIAERKGTGALASGSA